MKLTAENFIALCAAHSDSVLIRLDHAPAVQQSPSDPALKY